MKKTFKFIFTSLALMLVAVVLQSSGPRVLFIGDSITDGNWGGGDAKPSAERSLWDMNHIYGHGFMFLCASHYMGNYPECEYEFFNRGISGNTLKDLEGRWQEDVLDIGPDVLSVLVGVNDVAQYMDSGAADTFDYDEWGRTYSELLDRAVDMNPDLRIVLASPFVTLTGGMRERADFAEYNQTITMCADIVKKIAGDYGAVYLPYGEMFDEILNSTPTSQDGYWIWDGIHPTAAGHRRMADMWIERVSLETIPQD